MAGTTWGTSSKILKQICTWDISSVVEYASPTWASVTKSNTTLLDKVQNQSLGTVLGAMKSTLIAALEIT